MTVLIAALALVAAFGVEATAAGAQPKAAAPKAAAPKARAVKADAPAPHLVSSSGTKATCEDAPAGAARCFALRLLNPVYSAVAHDAEGHALPAGLSPANIQNAYGLPASGSGKTVAVVDAFDDPSAEADLAVYRSTYGLPACTTANGCFKKVNQTGGTSYPVANAGWATEIALDLDAVSAACPMCKILLVEATTNSYVNLGTAVNEAVALGASVVSNSYGGAEGSSNPGLDTSYYNHPGVAITVSTGDCGYLGSGGSSSCSTGGPEFPSNSPHVTAVGGTTLNTSGNARGWVESAWSGGGGGCSLYFAKPSFQHDSGCTNRIDADISAVADPATGLGIYDSYGSGGWAVYGGTSLAAPIVGGIYGRAANAGASDYPNSYPYAFPAGLTDVTSGSNGTCGGSYQCTAGVGYDGPTGMGTPYGTNALGPAPTVGLLRVTTSPAVPSQITVDGVIADTWGLQWVKESAGSHQVCFGAVAGFTAPACQNITITLGNTTVVTGTFVARGYLHVSTSPAVASQISVDGLPRNDWGLYTDFPVGSHQVCFGKVAGFTPPACQTVSVTAGATTNVTGTFTASAGTALTGVGQLRVTTSPAVPSQITVDGNIADTWGLTWLEIAGGSHSVCFTAVNGYTKPACQTVTVTNGATTTVTGTFVPRGYLNVITSPAVAGTITVNGVPADDWGDFTDRPVGAYTVCFGAVPGKTAPACQTPTVTAGTTTTITGVYT